MLNSIIFNTELFIQTLLAVSMTKHICKKGAALQYCKERCASFKAHEIHNEQIESDFRPAMHYLSCEVISTSPTCSKIERALEKKTKPMQLRLNSLKG